MANEKKFLDQAGVQYFWSQLSLEDYPNNETLVAVLNAIDETKADKSEIPNLLTYEFITIADIDAICEASIVAANEVTF